MIEVGDTRYLELVEVGRKAADANWVLGDAALEIAPMGVDHASNKALETLRRYAEDVCVEFNSLRVYRQVATAFPDATRVASTGWSAHRALMSRPDLIEPGMTVTRAKAALRAAGESEDEPEPEDDENGREALNRLAYAGEKVTDDLWELSTTNRDILEDIIWETEQLAKRFASVLDNLRERQNNDTKESSGDRPGRLQSVS